MQELVPLLEAHPLAFRAVALAVWLIVTVRQSRRPSFWSALSMVIAATLAFAPVPFVAVMLFALLVTEILETLKARAGGQ